MKRILTIALAAILILSTLAVFPSCKKDDSIKIGVVGSAEKDVWDYISETLAKEGIKIKIVPYTTYPIPNRALDDGEIDLNAFQHYAYFNSEIENHDYDLVSIGDTFISAMNIYSKDADGNNKLSSVDELKEGDKVAIPNDATNGGRALKILEAAGVITLKEGSGDQPTKSDIVSNPKAVQIIEMDAGSLYNALPDVDAAVINCNFALDHNLNPAEDGIFQDNISYYSGKSYVNLIAVHSKNKDNETYKRIVEVYQSQAVIDIFNDSFNGAYKPAWTSDAE